MTKYLVELSEGDVEFLRETLDLILDILDQVPDDEA